MDDAPMSDERRRILDSHLTTWTGNLRLERLLIELRADAIFNDHVIDVINGEKTLSMRRYQFIRQLQMRGNNAFESFYYALIKTNQRSLAEMLKDGMGTNEKSTKRNAIETNGRSLEPCLNWKEYRPFENGSSEFPIDDITAEAIEENERYYKRLECFRVKEPSGILHNLHVEYVDNRAPNGIVNFDEQIMYPNFSSPRGLALIINNRRFETMPERLGTDVDEANFSLLFRQLGYSPIVYRNLCSKEMVLGVQDFARRKEHSLVDSCVVCILTHGEHGELFGVDDQGVSVFELISLLNAKNCPALAHKPKIFFLQACRGQRYDRGFPGGDDTVDGLFDRFFSCTVPQRNCDINTDQRTKSPIEADILISYATTPGYVSWRNSMKGSWFIQSICEIFSKYAKDTDILSMLTMVNKRVAEAFESSSGAYKQIPDHSSRLRRSFYFFPGMNRPINV
uniref:Uncharacterized protein n=1 Tax=Parascaris univalens TaxID=6257 RepID=A0A915CFV6_PARUN